MFMSFVTLNFLLHRFSIVNYECDSSTSILYWFNYDGMRQTSDNKLPLVCSGRIPLWISSAPMSYRKTCLKTDRFDVSLYGKYHLFLDETNIKVV